MNGEKKIDLSLVVVSFITTFVIFFHFNTNASFFSTIFDAQQAWGQVKSSIKHKDKIKNIKPKDKVTVIHKKRDKDDHSSKRDDSSDKKDDGSGKKDDDSSKRKDNDSEKDDDSGKKRDDNSGKKR